MNQLATITSKKQLTIPAKLFKKAGLKEGEKVIVSEENGSLKITSAVKLVEELAGSVKVPEHLRGKNIDEITEQAAEQYFREKYRKKLK